MPLLSSKWTIAPEPVNRYPGSTQGSRWMFSWALSSEGDKPMTFKLRRQKNVWDFMPFSEQTGCYLQLKNSFKTSEMTRRDILLL